MSKHPSEMSRTTSRERGNDKWDRRFRVDGDVREALKRVVAPVPEGEIRKKSR